MATYNRSVLPNVDTTYEFKYDTRPGSRPEIGGHSKSIGAVASVGVSCAVRQDTPTALCLQRQQPVRNETTNEFTTSLSEFPCGLIELTD